MIPLQTRSPAGPIPARRSWAARLRAGARCAAVAALISFDAPAPRAVHADAALNDRTDDATPRAQRNPQLATNGIQTVAVWRDDLSGAHLQYAFSGDGGATYTDLNAVPAPAGGWRWVYDFNAACNPKTNEVWVAGQIITSFPDYDHGVGLVRGVLSSSAVTWDAPIVVNSEPGGGFLFTIAGECAMAMDTSDASLHLISPIYTDAGGETDLRLEYLRSNNGGASWSSPLVLTPPGPFYGGLVNLALSGDDILVSWLDSGDSLMWTRSSDGGTSWSRLRLAFQFVSAYLRSPHTTLGTFRPAGNGVTGSPWFGTFAIPYVEGWSPADEPFPSLTEVVIRSESESNNLPAQANPFSIGDAITGGYASSADVDCWSVSLTAGQGIQVWQDSSVAVSARVDILAPGAADTIAVSFGGRWVFMPPVSGTYVFQLTPPTSVTPPDFYRLRTYFSTPGPGEARDHGDVAVRTLAPGDTTWSAPRYLEVTPIGYMDGSASLHFAPDGYDYLAWADASPLPPGVGRHMRLSRGLLAAAAEPPVTLTSAPSVWRANIPFGVDGAPVSGSERLYVPWNDLRFGDADVRAGFVRLGAQLTYASTTGGLPGESLDVRVDVRNNSDAFPESPVLRVTGQRGWPSLVVPLSAIAPGQGVIAPFTLAIPDTAAPGTQLLTIQGEHPSGVKFGAMNLPMQILGCDTLYALKELATELESVYQMESADLDGDGHLDLLVAAMGAFGTPVVAWVSGDGEGRLLLDSYGSYESPAVDRAMALVDYFADGIPDAVVGSGSAVAVLRGGGSGGVWNRTFSEIAAGSSALGSVSALATGDFNEDGIPDLAVGSDAGPGSGAVRIRLATGAGGVWDLGFTTSHDELYAGSVHDLMVRDLNGDGIQDLVISSPSGSGRISVMLGNGAGSVGNGTFAAPVHYSSGSAAMEGLASGDFNDDGILDVAVAGSGIRVFLGNGSGGVGDGTFSGASAYDAGNTYAQVAVEDVTNDGRADLIGSATSLGGIVVLAGGGSGAVGDGTFAPSSVRPVLGSAGHLVIADYFEDGVADVLVASPYIGYISVLRGLCPSPLPGGIVVDDPGPLPEPGNVIHTPIRWQVGGEQTIAWSAGEAIQCVEVELSRDGGTHWRTLASRHVGSSLKWTVSGPPATDVVVRVRDSSVQSRMDATENPLEIIVPGVDVESSVRPPQVAFSAGVPNPFSRGVQFSIDLPADAHVSVELFDIAGKRAAVLLNGPRAAGTHVVRGGGRDDHGHPSAAGVYFARARIGAREFVRRLVKL